MGPMLPQRLVLLFLGTAVSLVHSYSAEDSFTWAIKSNVLASEYHQEVYDRFMEECRQDAAKRDGGNVCDQDEKHRMHMNSMQPAAVLNYTEMGFLKMRAPDEIFRPLRAFWEANKDRAIEEWQTPTPYHNNWESSTTIIRVDNNTLEGGGQALQQSIAMAARDAMEAWTGLPQSSTSVYGIRIYHTGAILAPHVDRLPLVSSCIINVAQDVDEDWLLEVYDHSGQAHNVSMAPGDLVLYESHSIIHGRPFPLKGKYYANIFVHFEPLGPPKGSTIPYKFDEENPLPPYLLADHPWVDDWRSQFPNGWSALESAVELTQRGDLKALRYLAEVNPNRLTETDGTLAEWQSIHEAARNGQLDIVKFLVEENEIDVNTPSKVTGAVTPLAIAMNHLKSDHPMIEYLIEMGGLEEVEEGYDDGEEL